MVDKGNGPERVRRVYHEFFGREIEVFTVSHASLAPSLL
jgi:hypothetical protein